MNRALPPLDPVVDGLCMAFSDRSAEPRILSETDAGCALVLALCGHDLQAIYSNGPEPEAAHRKKATLDGHGRGGRRRSR
jgi:hypothetical protein